MKTFPDGVSITPVATYSNEDQSMIFTVSKRTGGFGPDDYLVTGPNGFTATCRTQDAAIETARRELARVAQDA